MLGYVADIETLTEENTGFRRVLYSGPNLQLVLMSLHPGEEIGAETHENTDQFFRIETGEGQIEIDGKVQEVKSGTGIVVPAGARHNILCTGKRRMRIYTIYSPPHHQDRLIQKTKAEADGSDESFGGIPSETMKNGAAPLEHDRFAKVADKSDMEILLTRNGGRFPVRSATPSDDELLAEFFRHVTRADLRFRFLSGMHDVAPDTIKMLTHPDHKQVESFVVFSQDGMMLVATGMLACDDEFDSGEVAIAIREDHKNKGISWELLSYISRAAEAKGVRKVESIESRENHEAIELERDMGFAVTEYPGDASLVLVSRTLQTA